MGHHRKLYRFLVPWEFPGRRTCSCKRAGNTGSMAANSCFWERGTVPRQMPRSISNRQQTRGCTSCRNPPPAAMATTSPAPPRPSISPVSQSH